MIIIPELEKIIILVPRTGSGSLRRAIAKRYPESILLYRHMEADGVPAGYNRWEKVGVVRNPLARLWSLYKFLQHFSGDYVQSYIDRQRASVNCPFDEWLVSNDVVFTNPYSGDSNVFYPKYTVLHSLPENKKSQFFYLRPDLGTRIIKYTALRALEKELDIECSLLENKTNNEKIPVISSAAATRMQQLFAWDFNASN